MFERGSRSVHLTEEGELLYARASGPLGELAEAAELVRDGRARPRGRLRVNVPTVFGHLLMGRLAAEFIVAYPEVTLEVTLDDREVDPIAEGYDVVVRVNPKPDSRLVGRCFARDRVLVVAAPSVCPPDLEEAASVPSVTRVGTGVSEMWRLEGFDGRQLSTRPILRLPSLPMVRDAVIAGIGVAKLPEVLVAEDLKAGRLVSWGALSDPAPELWALHASSRLASAKVKAFLRLLDNAFGGAPLVPE